MANVSETTQQLSETLMASANEILLQLPGIFGALLLFVAGWFIAKWVKKGTLKLLEFVNHLVGRLVAGRSLTVVRLSDGISRLVAGVLFWVTVFIFTTAAMRTAGLTAIASWLEEVVVYLPAIIAGGVIILLGYILSTLVRDMAVTAAQSVRLSEAEMVGRLAQAITFVTAFIIGLNQLGVDVSFLTMMLGIATASLLLGFSIAFGLGAKTLVSNLVAAYYLREMVEPGQRVRIGEQEGTVLEVTSTSIIIDTAEGRTAVPTRSYHEQGFTLLLEDDKNE